MLLEGTGVAMAMLQRDRGGLGEGRQQGQKVRTEPSTPLPSAAGVTETSVLSGPS